MNIDFEKLNNMLREEKTDLEKELEYKFNAKLNECIQKSIKTNKEFVTEDYANEEKT
jgi:hypothetical protein